MISELYKVGNDVKMKFHHWTLELYSNGGTLWPDWLKKAGIDRGRIKSIRVAEGTVRLPEDARGYDQQKRVYTMFGGLVNAESIDLKGIDTSNATDMSYMFYNCNKLTTLDLGSFGTSKVTDMKSMFSNCVNLTDLDLSGFDTSHVTNMNSMFDNCWNLTDLNLSNFDTSNVTSMRQFDAFKLKKFQYVECH